MFRWITATSALALLLLTAIAQRTPTDLVGMDAIPSASGGCPPISSPHLRQDSTVQASAITFCSNGDADTGTVALEIPANALAENGLVIAGYLDDSAVRLNVSRTPGEPPVSIVARPAETWTDVTHRIPESWRGDPLTARLDDFGAGHTQWGGIGLRPRAPATQGWTIPVLLLSCVLFAIALLASVATPPHTLEGADGTGWGKGFRRWLPVATATLLVLMVGGAYYRTPDVGANGAPHPDQVIPVKVLQSMQSRGDLDTDWARADMPEHFLDFRYNFSGYILSSYLLVDALSPRSIPDDALLAERLRGLSGWYSAFTLAICFLLLARQLNLGYALAGTLAVALVPQLIQDAHYARPEALSTLLFTLCFALSTLRPRAMPLRWLVLAAVAATCGFLASIKFTYAISGIFAAVAAMPLFGTGGVRSLAIPDLLRVAGIVGGAFLAGFALGAPYAMLDPSAYLQGILALKHQYGGGHPPHMTMDGGFAEQASLITAYYVAVLGVPALLLHVGGYAGKRLAPGKFAYAAILALTIAGFLLQKVFFERNFSLLLPGFVIVAMLGIANIQERVAKWLPTTSVAGRLALAIIASVLFASMLYKVVPVALELSRHFTPKGQAAIHAARASLVQATQLSIGAARVTGLPFRHVLRGKYPLGDADCVLFKFDAYNDDWSARYLRQMPARLRVLGRIPSDFDGVPVSTLQVYHSPAVYLFADERSCPGAKQHPHVRRP